MRFASAFLKLIVGHKEAKNNGERARGMLTSTERLTPSNVLWVTNRQQVWVVPKFMYRQLHVPPIACTAKFMYRQNHRADWIHRARRRPWPASWQPSC